MSAVASRAHEEPHGAGSNAAGIAILAMLNKGSSSPPAGPSRPVAQKVVKKPLPVATPPTATRSAAPLQARSASAPKRFTPAVMLLKRGDTPPVPSQQDTLQSANNGEEWLKQMLALTPTSQSVPASSPLLEAASAKKKRLKKKEQQQQQQTQPLGSAAPSAAINIICKPPQGGQPQQQQQQQQQVQCKPQAYAWSAFQNSPDPKSLPLPSFDMDEFGDDCSTRHSKFPSMQPLSLDLPANSEAGSSSSSTDGTHTVTAASTPVSPPATPPLQASNSNSAGIMAARSCAHEAQQHLLAAAASSMPPQLMSPLMMSAAAPRTTVPTAAAAPTTVSTSCTTTPVLTASAPIRTQAESDLRRLMGLR
jgi:Proline-rich nuclear receptor coactivator motif